MRSDKEPIQGSIVFRCDLTNLPLAMPFRVGEMYVSPIAHGQEQLRKSSNFDSVAVSSVRLEIVTPIGTDVKTSQLYVEAQRIDLLTLLLSLATRNHVRAINQVWEELRGDDWAVINGDVNTPFLGKVKPRPISHMFNRLDDFLASAFPVMVKEAEENQRGLVSALRVFCSTYEDDYGEPLYLKCWMAFEILFGKFNGDALIIERTHFELVKQRLTTLLASDEMRDVLPIELADPMTKKLDELNRYSARKQANGYLADVFKDLSHLIPTNKELTKFMVSRNEIAHSGRFTPVSGEENYNKELGDLRLLLSGLLEIIFFVMLGGPASLIDSDWRHSIRQEADR